MFGCRLSGCFVVCLEDSTERSESNPGRSLGIITKEKRSVWKTVPPPDGIRYICKIRVRFTTEFFPRTRIYRIDADGSLMGWYSLTLCM